MESDLGIGALNSIQVGADGDTIDRNFHWGILYPKGYLTEIFSGADLPERFESDNVFGAALMLRRSALERVGGFDPLFFAYGEEVDLCRRLKKHGFRLAVLRDPPCHPSANEVQHPTLRLCPLPETEGLSALSAQGVGRFFLVRLIETCTPLARACLGRKVDSYPFNALPIRPKHARRALGWFLANALRIWWHVRIRERGAAFLFPAESNLVPDTKK